MMWIRFTSFVGLSHRVFMQLVLFLSLLGMSCAVGAAPIIRVSATGDADYRSIQEALNAAPSGALVKVGAGTYRENLAITNSVRIEGAGWNQTRIELPGITAPTVGETWERLLVELEKIPLEKRRAKVRNLFDRDQNRPLFIEGTNDVFIRGVGFHWVGPKTKDRSVINQLVEISNADVTLEDVVVLGSSDNAILAHRGAGLTMRRCLVAGNWGRGLMISTRNQPVKYARIIDCDIRHNYLSHITFAAGTREGLVSGCRLYGTAFFGIRPYSTNLVISGNAIFEGARSAFYSVGSDVLVTNNLLLNNAFGGGSSWQGNRSRFFNNTFANNGSYGIISISSGRPVIKGNIFYGHDNALHSSFSSGMDPKKAKSGDFEVAGRNLYYQNGTNWAHFSPNPDEPKKGRVKTLTPDQVVSFDPGFVNPAGSDFRLRNNSRARREGFGAVGFPSLISPFPLQPEEKAIIPEVDSWDFNKWKKPPKPDIDKHYRRLMALIQPPKPGPKRPAVTYEAAFRDLYETLGRRYPNFELKGIDWRAVGQKLLPRAKQVKDDRAFGLLCYELVARLEDSHALVGKGLINPPSVEYPRWDTGYACLIDDRGKPVVYHVTPNSPAAKEGVKPGMTVVSLNGRPAQKVLEQAMIGYSIYGSFSSTRYLQYQAARWFPRLEGKDTQVTTVMLDIAGKEHTFKLIANQAVRYLPRLPVPNPPVNDSANVSWKRLAGNIGLIYVRRIRSDLIPQLDKAVAGFTDAKGLIIDVRGNSGGGFDYYRSHLNFIEDRSKDPDRPRFTGPMALLIDNRCISAGEGWSSWFVTNKRARLFGSTTAGASSRKTTYTLKNELYKVTFPVKAYRGYLDRVIERRGLEPDVPLRQNAKDLAAGRDTVLEAARDYLLKQ